ncbi:hypothetical protein LIA77_05474 [Sarocladium implicatum]|nr:hypothetical protein LIA77_05474 [Sarocladium implicatum]
MQLFTMIVCCQWQLVLMCVSPMRFARALFTLLFVMLRVDKCGCILLRTCGCALVVACPLVHEGPIAWRLSTNAQHYRAFYFRDRLCDLMGTWPAYYQSDERVGRAPSRD